MNLTNLTLKRPFKTYHFASASSVVLFTEHKYQELWKKKETGESRIIKINNDFRRVHLLLYFANVFIYRDEGGGRRHGVACQRPPTRRESRARPNYVPFQNKPLKVDLFIISMLSTLQRVVYLNWIFIDYH